MRKKVLALLLSAAAVVSSLFACLSALGDDTAWQYDSSSATLYIYGTGAMDDYEDEFSSPWNMYANVAKRAVIEEGVTTVGAYAFAGMSKLESVQLPSTVSSIGSYSMAECPSLKALDLGAEITQISDVSFAYSGADKKADFVVNTVAGSYPLYYAVNNDIPFCAESAACGSYKTVISVKGMKGYYPYTPKCDGTFRFYSSGAYDTKGCLYDSSFNQLAYNDDASSSNTNFSITYSLEKGETYYISAELFSKGLLGSFDFTIEAVSFTVDGKVSAMADRSGAPSDILIDDALMDDESVSSHFVIDVTGGSVTKKFSYKNQSKYVTFTPDSDSDVIFMACDVNEDGYVNAKDFAVMRKENSKYLPLYEAFINYSCK